MPAGVYLGQEEFRVTVLPARVVYLIRAGSKEGYRRSVQEASTRWGGVTEPIVPVRASGRIDGFWRQVVACANVDEAVNVDLPSDLGHAAAELLHLPVVPIADIDIAGIGAFTAHPSAIAGEQTSMRTSFRLEGSESVPTIWTFAANTLDLWAITAAGALTEGAESGSKEISDPIVLQRDSNMVALAQINGHTGLDRTASQLEQRWASPIPFRMPAIVWITPSNSLLECLLYWNRRAIRTLGRGWSPMVILPESELRYWPHIGMQLRGLFQGRPDEFEPDIYLMSNSVRGDRLREIGVSLELVESKAGLRVEETWPPPPVRQPPFTFRVDLDPTPSLLFMRRYGVSTIAPAQVFRERTSVAFELPVKFAGPAAFKIILASEIFDRFPKRPEVARLIEQNSSWHDDGLQILGRQWPRYRYDLKVPTLREVAAAMLTSVANWALSDKGRIGQSVISARSLDALLSRGLYEAIRDLTTRRSKQLVREIEGREHTDEELDRARFVAEIGGRLERRSQAASDLQRVAGSARVEALEKLVALNWAQRGLRIVCGNCDNTSFIEMHAIDRPATCPGCGSPQAYERSTQGVTVYYRLNSLIDRASDQGVLPHLLAIAALRRRSEDTFVFPGVNVRFANGDTKELDLFGVHAGRVLAGEVKTTANGFSMEQVSRDVDLTAALGADTHVIACTEELRRDAADRARKLAQSRGLEVLMLGATDLRP